ncbi:MAG: Rid family hydrolase [Acidobacteriota bacterium]|jgi:enamine deaminase RidA (YjgF/YER057c/UK114 family)
MRSVTENGSDLVLLTWTGVGGGRAVVDEAEKAYTSLAAELRGRGALPIQERVFGSLRSAPDVARGRARALGSEDESWAVPPTYVEGGPVGHDGLAGIHVVAARPERSHLVTEGDRVLGRIVDAPSACLLGLADVGRRAAGRLAAGPAEEAGATIDAAVALLEGEGYSFRNVARTWFYLRDILDWYGPFNAVRNATFQRLGLLGRNGHGEIPASTGIEGRNARGAWCTLDLIAARARPGRRFEMERLHNRKQSEATEYGSAFARGTALTLGDCRYYFVSGTASIDDHGRTVHVGDFVAQAEHTLTAVSALLESAGAALPDVRQATAFLKNPGDQSSFERIADRAGLSGVPMVTAVADVCREELLFEIDATAVVPLRRRGAGR